jgi:hypothetical protein
LAFLSSSTTDSLEDKSDASAHVAPKTAPKK